MFSTFIAQWESANLAAFQRLGKTIAQSAHPSGVAGAAIDAGAWRAWLRTSLQGGQQYLSAYRCALDADWRDQRDRLGLTNTAAALKELAALNADLATRAAQGHVQHAGVLADAAAQYLGDLGRSRNAADAAMALGRFATDLGNQARAHALHAASLAGGVPPALAQWAERHLDDDAPTTEQTP
ncbi:hypothetical protein [Burkholderia alba]|uniref:hypothetical protein n=1 Tax=Burkholderia alba TaxID=2683677 RepID=UPI002B05685C|nr:hypothetical protein [Burkholderia alba]